MTSAAAIARTLASADEILSIAEADVQGKRVLVRVDFNVPMDGTEVTDTTRLEAAVATVNAITEHGGMAILLSHFGRPKGAPDPAQSLAPVVPAFEKILGRPVSFCDEPLGAKAEAACAALQPGDVIVLENTRFVPGEEKAAPDHVAALAALGDIYVNDAFSCAHRAHTSTEGLARRLPAYAGLALLAEVEALTAALDKPQRPLVAVVGGAKVSTKIELLANLVNKVDALVIGGGMANTFLAAQGVSIGKSLCEHDLADTAREIIAKADSVGCRIILPVDAVVAKKLKAGVETRIVDIAGVADDEMILDAGPRTIERVANVFETARSLVWNGPFGAFEIAPFDKATVALATRAASLTAAGKLLSVGGGGDTVAALNHAGAAEGFSYVSTAGGAFLEWLEGKALPGIEVLRQH